MGERIDMTFRVFVSSTFSDMKAERNVLQEKVFPKLRDYCQKYGARFQAIDLRWGISEEAALDQQTMNICLEELRYCQRISPRPNFIVLLGQRYGWRPLPPQIRSDEFKKLMSVISAPEQQRLLEWYREDKNADPAEYSLLPRDGKFKDNALWMTEEQELHAILREAVSRIGWPANDARRLKYEASATHQEIHHGALQVKDTIDHVFGFLRTITGLPQDAAARDFVDLDKHGNPDPEAKKEIDLLKYDMQMRLKENIFTYQTAWNGTGPSNDHLNKLCDDVYACLKNVIENEIQRRKIYDPVDQESVAHQVFGSERAKIFIGRNEILGQINQYLNNQDRSLLVIHGISGSGKSAVMAKAVEQLGHSGQQETVVRYIGATPSSSDIRSLLEGICKEIALKYGSESSMVPSDYNKLVANFPAWLALATKEKPLVLFLDALDQLSDAEKGRNLSWLPERLPENVKIIVSTLPEECLTVLRQRTTAQDVTVNPRFLEIRPMSMNEGEELLETWLKEAQRTLQQQQRQEVLTKFSTCQYPLYLKLSFEEARHWKSWETTPVNLAPDIPGILKDTFARLESERKHGPVLVSRTLGYLAASRYGLAEEELLDVLSSDYEVMEELRRRSSAKSPKLDRLPVVVWVRLFADIEPYMTQKRADNTSVITFYHRQVGEAAQDRYLKDNDEIRYHRHLADYFGGRTPFALQPMMKINETGMHEPNLRKLSELPRQQIWAEMWAELAQTLVSLEFVEAKTKAGMVYDLLEDYNQAVSSWPGREKFRKEESERKDQIRRYIKWLTAEEKDTLPEPNSTLPDSILKNLGSEEGLFSQENDEMFSRIKAWQQFVILHTRELLRGRITVFQLAYNSADSGFVVEDMEKRLAEKKGPSQPWFKLLNRTAYEQNSSLMQVLDGHNDGIWCMTVSVDGRHAVSCGKDKLVHIWDMEYGRRDLSLSDVPVDIFSSAINASGNRVIVGCVDGSIRCLDLSSRRFVWSQLLHSAHVNSVAITADGAIGFSAGGDRSVLKWDMSRGNCLKRWQVENEGEINGITVSHDGQLVVTAHETGSVCIWDGAHGECLHVLSGHEFGARSVCLTVDKQRIVSVGRDAIVRVWDAVQGRIINTLEGHRYGIHCVAISPQGKLAMSGGSDGIKIWDLTTGRCLKTLCGHEEWVSSVWISPDCKEASSSGWDGRICRWNLEKLLSVNADIGKTEQVSITSICLSPDESSIVTGNNQGMLRRMNIHTGRIMWMENAHQGVVRVLSPLKTREGFWGVTAGSDGLIRLWNLEDGSCFRNLEGHDDVVCSLVPGKTGPFLFSGSYDNTFRTWNLNTGECVNENFKICPYPLVLSCDDKSAYAGKANMGLAIRSYKEKEQAEIWKFDMSPDGYVEKWQTHGTDLTAMVLSTDDKILITGSSHGAIVAYDPAGDMFWWAHNGAITSLHLLGEDRFIISSGEDRSLQLRFRNKTGSAMDAPLAEFECSSPVTCCSVGTSESLIAVGTQGGKVNILEIQNLKTVISDAETASNDLIDQNTSLLDNTPGGSKHTEQNKSYFFTPPLSKNNSNAAAAPALNDDICAWLSSDGKQITEIKHQLTIGRSEPAELVISDPAINRSHAEIRKFDGRFVLCDLNSTNGTFLNGLKITRYQLTDGDHIRIGNQDFIFNTKLVKRENTCVESIPVQDRFAVMSDIHANIEALRAVVADARKMGCSGYVCSGDIIGYNASPGECIDLIRKMNFILVRGNHEHYCSHEENMEDFEESAADVINWTKKYINEDQMEYLLNNKYVRLHSGFAIVHGTLDMPEKWGYVIGNLEASANFMYQCTSLAFCGHTHTPGIYSHPKGKCYSMTMDLQLGTKYLVNCGSVGQPRDGDPRACYFIYDKNKKHLEIRRVPYDVSGAKERIYRAGLPDICAKRLSRSEYVPAKDKSASDIDVSLRSSVAAKWERRVSKSTNRFRKAYNDYHKAIPTNYEWVSVLRNMTAIEKNIFEINIDTTLLEDNTTLEYFLGVNDYVMLMIESYWKMLMLAFASESRLNKDTIEILNDWLNFIMDHTEPHLNILDMALNETQNIVIHWILQTEKEIILSIRDEVQSCMKANSSTENNIASTNRVKVINPEIYNTIQKLYTARKDLIETGNSFPDITRNSQSNDAGIVEHLQEMNHRALILIETYINMLKIILASGSDRNNKDHNNNALRMKITFSSESDSENINQGNDALGILSSWLKFIVYFCEKEEKHLYDAIRKTEDITIVSIINSENKNISSLHETAQQETYKIATYINSPAAIKRPSGLGERRIIFQCVKCGKDLSSKPIQIGHWIRCVYCQQEQPVPRIDKEYVIWKCDCGSEWQTDIEFIGKPYSCSVCHKEGLVPDVEK